MALPMLATEAQQREAARVFRAVCRSELTAEQGVERMREIFGA